MNICYDSIFIILKLMILSNWVGKFYVHENKDQNISENAQLWKSEGHSLKEAKRGVIT